MIIKTDNQNYFNIANAIREKNKTTETYKPSEMAFAIKSLFNGNEGLLPEGYAQLEYIESTGTQYIDTDYAFADNFSWEITFKDIAVSNTTLFGGRTSAARTALLYYGNSSSNNGVPYMCCSIAGMNGTATPFKFLDGDPTEKNTVKMTVANNTATVWFNGEKEYENTTFDGEYISGVTQVIFADNYGTEISEHTSVKLYGLKMWQGDTLVRDFIPCVNFSEEIGLYDLVEGKFYANAGTGKFIMGVKEFTKLDYIESSGTQYINTGHIPTNNTKVIINLTPVSSGLSEHAIFGSTWAANGFFLMFYQNMLRWHSKGVSVDVSNFNIDGKNEIICTTSKLTVNGTDYNLNGTGTDTTNPITLFYAADYAYSNNGIYRLHSCKIYENDLLVKDFIPCQTSAGEIGLWDLIGGKFYNNVGTGNFIPGEKIIERENPDNIISCLLTVETMPEAIVSATLEDRIIYAAADSNGIATLVLKKEGLWTASAIFNGETKSTEILVEHNVEEELAFTKTFRIIHNNVQYDYKFLKNWTWADFIASEYNDGNFTIDGTNVRFLGCSVHIDRVLVTTSSALQEISYSVLPIMYVYEPGYTSFKNTDGYGATGVTSYCQFRNAYVEIYGAYQENYETYNISFTEARYKGYKKLIIKANANVSNCKISWGSTSIYVGYSTQEFVIDISNDTGSRNINFQTYGEQKFTVYDIHFE